MGERTAKTIKRTPAQRAATLPMPEPGKVITVPLELLPFYLERHKLTPSGRKGDALLVKKGSMEAKRNAT